MVKLDQLRVDRDADQLRPRKTDAISRGGMFALIAHAGLIVALAFGVSWRSSEPEGVEAELWAAVPQIAAAPATPPPEPKPEPKPQPVPEPPVVKPPPVPERSEADIAIEKQKREQKEREQREADEKQKKLEAQKKAEEQKREEQKREEAEKRKKDEERRKQEAIAAKARQEQLARVMGQAGATGAENSTGTALQSAGPSAGYAGRIKARVKPNVTFTDEVAGNPLASVEVRCAPDGTITGRKLVKSSGVPAWDDAVVRAIDKTEVLPRDENGRCPSPMVLDFRPRDF